MIPKLPDNTSGTTPIPKVFQGLKDQELAQRLSTKFFGLERAFKFHTGAQVQYSKPEVEILREFNFEIDGVLYGVVLVKATQLNIYGVEFSYLSLITSFDLIHLEDDRFVDAEGGIIHSGIYSSSGIKTPLKDLASHIRIQEIQEEIYTDKLSYYLGDNELKESIIHLTERFYSPEWIGTSHNAGLLYIQDLSEILGIEFSKALRIVRVLDHESKILVEGYTVHLPVSLTLEKSNSADPTRPYAEYSEFSGNEIKIKVFTPASLNENQVFLTKCYKGGEIFDVLEHPFMEEISSAGDPSDKDFSALRRLLNTYVAQWRSPYVSPRGLDLNLIEDNEIFKNEGVNPRLPSSKFKSVRLEGGLHATVFIPSNSKESQSAMIVMHGEGESPDFEKDSKIMIPIEYPVIFGLDQDDEIAIMQELQKI